MSRARHMLCSDTGKVVHFTLLAAQQVAKKLGDRRPYRCTFCNFWHLAANKKGGRRKKKRSTDLT